MWLAVTFAWLDVYMWSLEKGGCAVGSCARFPPPHPTNMRRRVLSGLRASVVVSLFLFLCLFVSNSHSISVFAVCFFLANVLLLSSFFPPHLVSFILNPIFLETKCIHEDHLLWSDVKIFVFKWEKNAHAQLPQKYKYRCKKCENRSSLETFVTTAYHRCTKDLHFYKKILSDQPHGRVNSLIFWACMSPKCCNMNTGGTSGCNKYRSLF